MISNHGDLHSALAWLTLCDLFLFEVSAEVCSCPLFWDVKQTPAFKAVDSFNRPLLNKYIHKYYTYTMYWNVSVTYLCQGSCYNT